MLEPVTSTLASLAIASTKISASVVIISENAGITLAAIVSGMLSLSGISSILASILPHPTKEGLYHKVHHFINLASFNIGNATNKVRGIQKDLEDNHVDVEDAVKEVIEESLKDKE